MMDRENDDVARRGKVVSVQVAGSDSAGRDWAGSERAGSGRLSPCASTPSPSPSASPCADPAVALSDAEDIAVALIRLAGDATVADSVRMDLCRALARTREQEKAAQERALELERLNDALVQETNERRRLECIAQTQSRALQRSLELLVQEPDIEGFISVIAKTLVEECEALSCGVWLLDEAEEQSQLWMIRTKDQLYTRNGDHCVKTLPIPHAAFAEHLVAHRPGWTQTIDYYGTDDRFSKAAQEFHRERDVVHLTVAPLVLGTRNLGWIALSTAQADDCEGPWRVALLEAMSRQAALALHMNRLGEQSRVEERRKAILEERTRLARDIHDTLAQGFAAILMQLQAAQRQAGKLAPAVTKSLETAIDLARTHIVEARRSMSELRPRVLDGRDLASALRQLTDAASRTSDVPIDLAVEGELSALPASVEDEIIRIAQEAVANATRHARAKRITVRAASAHGVGLRLSVADDGRGFDPNRTSGFGMISMQERAERIGASLTIVTAPRHGAEVVLAWTPPSVPDRAAEGDPSFPGIGAPDLFGESEPFAAVRVSRASSPHASSSVPSVPPHATSHVASHAASSASASGSGSAPSSVLALSSGRSSSSPSLTLPLSPTPVRAVHGPS
jgi:signal transduction histidine kinase